MNLHSIVRPPSLVEVVCEKLAALVRDRLCQTEGWLPTERELSTQLGVSRSVVREATKRLETQGLVEVQHGIGIRAVDCLHRPLNSSLALLLPDVTDRLRALVETRLSLEPDVAAYAAQRASRTQLRELKRIHRRLEDAPDHQTAVEADSAFHHALAEASGNLIYRLILDSLGELSISSRLRTLGRVGKERAIEHHAAILRAVEAGEPETARQAMRAHILAAGEDLDLPAPGSGATP